MSKDKYPLVSVIVNCYNCEKYLPETLKSIETQTYPNYELIFIDNCSTDKSAEIARNFFENLNYIRLDNKVSLYTARNIALDLIKGEYVAFIDSDDVWGENKLSQQVALFDKETVLVYCKRIFIDENGERINKKDSKKYTQHVVNRLLMKPFIPMSSVVIRSDVALSLRFDRRFNLIGDFDMWLRVAMQGEIKYVDKILLQDRIHHTSSGKKEWFHWVKEHRVYYQEFFNKYGLKYPGLIVYVMRSEMRHMLILLGFMWRLLLSKYKNNSL